MEVGQDGSILIVGLAAALGVGWGAGLSVRSAVRGPSWALSHLGAARRLLPLAAVAAVLLVAVVRPVWVGLGVGYVVATVWWLAAMLRRSLVRVESAGGFDEIPRDRRLAIVARARRLLYGGGGILLVVGLMWSGRVGALAWVSSVLGAVLVVTATLLGREDPAGG